MHVTCLTCDSISQVKGKILHQLKPFSQVSIDECQLYLFINPSYSSVSSASSSGSSSVPLTRKSLRGEASVHRTMKFPTTLISNESNCLCLHDVDQTNEQTNDGKRLNTLQHYGIINDGYEFRMILPKNLGRTSDPKSTLNHQCSSCMFNEGRLFRYLSSPPASSSIVFPLDFTHRQRYCHLFTHSYEEIDRGYDLSSTSDDPNRTARLFQTKAMIQPGLLSLIEILFTDLRHIDTFLSESIEQYPRLLHVFYAHFIPFIIEHLHCLFDVPIDMSLTSSLRTLASIFAIACRESNEFSCSLCVESRTNAGDYLTEQCSLLFADEIERVRFYYSTLEQCSASREFTSEYSSTNTGIETSFELDPSLIDSLMDYASNHANEIVEAWRRISSDETTLSSFINLVQVYRSTGRT